MAERNEDKPIFKGLTWQRGEHFSLFVPNDWHEYPWPDGREGRLFRPPQAEAGVILAVEVKDLGFSPQAEDKEALEEGFLEGIKVLEGAVIEEHKSWVVGSLICLEAKYRYVEGREVKRWARALYHKSHQISFIAQAPSTESFDYWLPMFYEAMMTSRSHDTKPSLQQPALHQGPS